MKSPLEYLDGMKIKYVGLRICDFIIKWGVVFLIGFGPLVFGSVQRGAYTILEAVAFILLLTWFLKIIWDKKLKFSRLFFLVPLIPFLGLIFLQLIPFPESVISYISPSTHSIRLLAFPKDTGTLGLVGASENLGLGNWPISLYPHATKVELLKIFSYLAVFFVVVNNVNSRSGVLFFLWTLIFFGFVYSVFAIAQKFTWNGMAYWFIRIRPERSPFGPFINPNHFAGYVEMLIPLAMGLWFSGKRKKDSSEYGFPVLSTRNIFSSENGYQFVLFLMCAVMMTALFLSLSRGGMVSVLFSVIAFGIFLRRKNTFGRRIFFTLLFFTFCGILLISWLAYQSVSREIGTLFLGHRVFDQGWRLQVWQKCLVMVQDFPIFGIGLAAFEKVYSTYKPPVPQIIFVFAENDYLQILVETGILGAVLVGLAIIGFLIFVGRRFSALRDPKMIKLAAGGMASGIAIAAHSFFDFNLHIPSNAFQFTIIMGLLVTIVSLRGTEWKERFTLPLYSKSLSKGGMILFGVFVLCIVFVGVVLAVSTRQAVDEIHFNAGERAFFRMGLLEKISPEVATKNGRIALGEFDAAISHNPLEFKHHVYRGYVEAKLRDLLGGSDRNKTLLTRDYNQTFRNALRLFPSNGNLHYMVGMHYLKNWQSLTAKQRKFGSEAFKKALILNPYEKYKEHAKEFFLKRGGGKIDPRLKKLL